MALSDEDRQNLVAYLDGELDEAASQALEAKLANDPGAREEADTLKRTWELLDYLPRTEASTNFTHRTLERLAVQTASQPEMPRPAAPPVRRLRLAWLGWAAAVLLAAGGGVLAARLVWPARPAAPVQPETADVGEQLARYLRILENRRLYEHVDDLQFLRGLDTPELFGDDSW